MPQNDMDDSGSGQCYICVASGLITSPQIVQSSKTGKAEKGSRWEIPYCLSTLEDDHSLSPVHNEGQWSSEPSPWSEQHWIYKIVGKHMHMIFVIVSTYQQRLCPVGTQRR